MGCRLPASGAFIVRVTPLFETWSALEGLLNADAHDVEEGSETTTNDAK